MAKTEPSTTWTSPLVAWAVDSRVRFWLAAIPPLAAWPPARPASRRYWVWSSAPRPVRAPWSVTPPPPVARLTPEADRRGGGGRQTAVAAPVLRALSATGVSAAVVVIFQRGPMVARLAGARR